MKKILICSHAMELGGAEKALLGLLDTIDTNKYSVDLFLMRHSGELLKYIPNNVNLLPQNAKYAMLAVPMSKLFKKGRFFILLLRLLAKTTAFFRKKQLKLEGKNSIELEYSHKFTACAMPKINDNKYDLAISFLTPHYFVDKKVKAKRKVAWIHTDYSNVKIDVKSELKMWSKFDNIISISDDVTKSFVKIFPSLKDKIIIIENIISKSYIDSLVNEFTVENEMPSDGSIKLLSIGRFGHAKNFDNVPEICKSIIDAGLNVKWYLIGFGSDEQLIRQKIAELDMRDNVIILGKKENPYPYIKACDVYVQPSRFEGKSIAVREAQILQKPVIITNFATANSQLNDGVDGIIVPSDNEQCASAICKFIANTNLKENIIKNLVSSDYTNSHGMDKIYKLVD